MKNIIIDSVAVFILSTTKNFGGISSFQSRMVEISETWAKPFEHVNFVMGTNQFDYDFLQEKCVLKASFGDPKRGPENRRKLVARTPQTPTEDVTREYECDYTKDMARWGHVDPNKMAGRSKLLQQYFREERHALNVLYVGNCTGEYFGIGPACRYQETSRYFLSHAGLRNVPPGAIRPQSNQGKFRHVEWYLFIDDDLYVRPYGLLSMLRSLPRQHSGEAKVARMKGRKGYHDSQDEDRQSESQSESVSVDFPVALLAPLFQRSFRFSARWDRKAVNCDTPVHNLHIAMPALINREAMALMGNAVEACGMTEHQRIWGGTHDMLLGLWLWMYQIPQLSVRKVYFGGMVTALYKEEGRGDMWIRNINPQQSLFVHMLKHFDIPYEDKGGQGNTTRKYHEIPGMMDVAKIYGDDVIYDKLVYMLPKEGQATGAGGGEGGARSRRKRPRASQLEAAGLNTSDIDLGRGQWKKKYHEQVSQGRIAGRTHLFELTNSRVGETRFGSSGRAGRVHEQYHSFVPGDCQVMRKEVTKGTTG